MEPSPSGQAVGERQAPPPGSRECGGKEVSVLSWIQSEAVAKEWGSELNPRGMMRS